MKFHLLIVIFVLATIGNPAAGQITCDVRHNIDVPFALGSTALPDTERERVMKGVERIRNADYCPFAFVRVTGHSTPAEELSRAKGRVSIERAHYVARLLELGGIPKRLIHVESEADSQPLSSTAAHRSARVEVDVSAGCPSTTNCPFPLAPSGLRLPTTH